MNVAPLASGTLPGLESALLSHGWEGALASTASRGIETAAFHLTEVAPATLEELVRVAGRFGLEVVTGENWAVLAGSRSRLTAFARPWSLPPELSDAAIAIARALPSELPTRWETAVGPIALDAPLLVGILNLTPDSFSDGGRLESLDASLRHAERLIEGGAGVLDVGGESTRPGRPEPVPVSEELQRVIPVVDALRRRWPALPLSIDTVKSAVARAALDAGVAIVNDVSAGRLDPRMMSVVAEHRAGVVLMHSRGTVADMASYDHAAYPGGVITGIVAELREAIERASAAGVAVEHVVLDPGLGFSKTAEQSVVVCGELAALRCLGRPIMVGPSRKRFLGQVTGRRVEDRDRATAAACALLLDRGAKIFRVHDPAAVHDALLVGAAIGTSGVSRQ